MSRAS
jgi:hypothetical protein